MQTQPFKSKIDDIVKEGTEIAEQFKHFTSFAKDILEKEGHFMPMIHGFTEDKKVVVIACPWDGPEAKSNFLEKVGPLLLSANKVESFIFGSEVHMKRMENLEEHTGSLEGDPEAQDGLMCLYVSEGTILHNIMPVTLIKNNSGEVVKATVGKGQWADADGMSGRIVDLLKNSKKIPHVMAKTLLKLAGKNTDEPVLSKEDREEVVEFIMEEAKKGKLPMDMAETLKDVHNRMNG